MISIKSGSNDITVSPTDTVPVTTLQELIDILKPSAFLDGFTGIDDSSTDRDKTYSANKLSRFIGDSKIKTLRENDEYISFNIPSNNDNTKHLIDVYASDGSNYVGMDTSTDGIVTLVYEPQEYDRTIILRVYDIV
jgi:hypothetical protein